MVGRGKQFTGRTRRFGIGLAIATGVVALCSPSRAEDLAAALAARNRAACGVVAPPEGLYLVKVDY